MTEKLRRPRCECCDEVLEELLAMRQNFEKFFHRFNGQVVELRRELRAVLEEKSDPNQTRATPITGQKRRARSRSRSPSPPIVAAEKPPSVMERKQLRRERNNLQLPTTENSRGSSEARTSSSMTRQQSTRRSAAAAASSTAAAAVAKVKVEPRSHSRSSVAKRPVLEFFGIQLRVMPTCPFNTDKEFDEWEHLLQTDEDQRDNLRVELMQGHFDDAEKYVKHIWSSLLSDEAAKCYTYRGNVKTDKKAIKDYTFTSIFKECFLNRYERQDGFFFMERTMRFFNYVHDRLRRVIKAQEQTNKFEKIEIYGDPVTYDDEQSMDEDESLVNVMNENEVEGVFVDDSCDGAAQRRSTNIGGTNIEDNIEEFNDKVVTKNDLLEFREDLRRDLEFVELKIIKEITELQKHLTENYLNEMTADENTEGGIKRIKYSNFFIGSGKSRILPKSPLTEIEDFKVFEERIDNHEDKFAELVADFMEQKTDHSEKFLKICWRKLLADEAAQHLCWKGTDKKIAVRKLSVTSALRKAYNEMFKYATDVEFERTCIFFFQHAKNRYEKKKLYHNQLKSAEKKQKIEFVELSESSY